MLKKLLVVMTALLTISTTQAKGIDLAALQKMNAFIRCDYIASGLTIIDGDLLQKSHDKALDLFLNLQSETRRKAFEVSPRILAQDYALAYHQAAVIADYEMEGWINDNNLPFQSASWVKANSEYWDKHNCLLVLGG